MSPQLSMFLSLISRCPPTHPLPRGRCPEPVRHPGGTFPKQLLSAVFLLHGKYITQQLVPFPHLCNEACGLL